MNKCCELSPCCCIKYDLVLILVLSCTGSPPAVCTYIIIIIVISFDRIKQLP